MKRQIRVGVFETNSSSEHSLTLMKVVDKSGDIGANMAAIPANTTYEFRNKKIYDMEYGDDDSEMFYTEQDKLALCVALCKEMYEADQRIFYWDYHEEMEEKGVTLHEVVKDKPFFEDLIQAVKEERNTDLILVDCIHTLESQSGEVFRGLINSYQKVVSEDISDATKFFKDIIFGEYSVHDEVYCTD